MKYTEHSVKVSTERLETALALMNRMDIVNKELQEELKCAKRLAELTIA